MTILKTKHKFFTPLIPYPGSCIFFLMLFAGCNIKDEKKIGEKSKRPNILFAFSDDQSWLHTGAFGDNIVKTPAPTPNTS